MPEPSLPACPLCIYLYAHMYCTYVSVTPRWCGFCSRASHVIFTDFSNFACLPYRSLLLLGQRLQKEFGIVEFLVAIQMGSSLEPLETEVALEPLEILALLALVQHQSAQGVVVAATLAQELVLRAMTHKIWRQIGKTEMGMRLLRPFRTATLVTQFTGVLNTG